MCNITKIVRFSPFCIVRQFDEVRYVIFRNVCAFLFIVDKESRIRKSHHLTFR